MANANTPFGFKLYGNRDDLEVQRFLAIAGNGDVLGIGDPVKLAGSAEQVQSGDYLPTIARTAAGNRVLGVVLGVDPYEEVAYNSVQLGTKHRAASTRRVITVCTDKNARYVVQMDTSGTTVTLDEIGELYDQITAADANSVSGISIAQLSQTSHGTGSGQFRLESFLSSPDNAVGANVKCIVSINEKERWLETDGV